VIQHTAQKRVFLSGLLLTAMAGFVPLLFAQEYSTYIGGANVYQVARVTADSAGNTYIAGTRLLDEASDLFVTKLDTTGKTVWFRNIAGQGYDVAADMAMDTPGNIYIAGSTTSVNFPVVNAFQSKPGPGFVVKLSADGSQILWSTYFREKIAAIAADGAGGVYVTGSTHDPTYPVTAGLPNGPINSGIGSNGGAFLTKIAVASNRVVYSTIIAGNAVPCTAGDCTGFARSTAPVSIALDPSGDAYLAGNTATSDLPATAGALLKTGYGAFVAAVKADGSGLLYLTYIGSGDVSLNVEAFPGTTATAIACDASGNVYLAGSTFDSKFPATSGAFQTSYDGPAVASFPLPPTDAFALKLNSTGSALVWASYLGGSGADVANALAVDSSGQIWLAGTTSSPDFPNAQGWSQGNDFIGGLNSSGSKLAYAARYPSGASSRSIAVDGTGLLHVSGPNGLVSTVSPGNTPLTRVFGVANAANGPLDGRVSGGEVISIYGPHIGPPTAVTNVPDSSGNLPLFVPGYQVITGLGNGPSALAILYASDSQINAVIPFGATGNGTIHVITPNGTTSDFLLTGMPSRPEVFHNADGSIIAINQDGTLNSASNPAVLNSYVSIWMTGSGEQMAGFSGQIASAANDRYCCGVLLESAYSVLTQASVSYAGDAPGAVLGVSQVNFQVALAGFANYPATLRVTGIDGSQSLPLTLYVQ
jgi:uncharacterized protein (TIGR03437 family)